MAEATEDGTGLGLADESALDTPALELSDTAIEMSAMSERSTDPLGLTLSSIRHKSLYKSGRLEIFLDPDWVPTSCHRALSLAYPTP